MLWVVVTMSISSIPFFSNISALWKHTLVMTYDVHISQVSPQLSSPVIYKSNSSNHRGILARSKSLQTEKLTNGASVTPTPGDAGGQGFNNHGILHELIGFSANSVDWYCRLPILKQKQWLEVETRSVISSILSVIMHSPHASSAF